MKIACIQMNMKLGAPQENFCHAEELIAQAMQNAPDVLVLPETWNTGFFPRERLRSLSCDDLREVKRRIGAFAGECGVNIVAGSVSNVRGGKVYNTAAVFDRTGRCIAQYDKTHLFTPMGEQLFYTAGNRLCRFVLDDVPCGVMLCYDVRFPEIARSLALTGAEVLFLPAQWPRERLVHLQQLCLARAIENQMFIACCNSCGTTPSAVYGGGSAVIDPLGNVLTQGGAGEEILFAECDLQQLADVRRSIPVFHDRRWELYEI